MQENIKLMKKNTLLNPVYFKTDNNGTNKKNAVQKEDLEGRSWNDATASHINVNACYICKKKKYKNVASFQKSMSTFRQDVTSWPLHNVLYTYYKQALVSPPQNGQTFSQAALPEGHERLWGRCHAWRRSKQLSLHHAERWSTSHEPEIRVWVHNKSQRRGLHQKRDANYSNCRWV